MSVRDLQSASGFVPGFPPDEAPVVLLVDDDALVLEAIGPLISHLGCIPVLASTGEEALALLDAGLEPALVILDLDMPGLGGARTLPWIRAIRPHLPVLISTGSVHSRARELIRAYDQVGLLPKPYGLQELKERLVASA